MKGLALVVAVGGLLISAASYALYQTGYMGWELAVLQHHATARFRGSPLTPWTLIWLGLLGLPISLRLAITTRDAP